jgi:hypothetical protein
MNPFSWSGRRGSNPRPTAWKAVTLPLSYSRMTSSETNGGERRIRTSVGRSRQIYSLLRLTTPPSLHETALAQRRIPDQTFRVTGWSWRRDSNPRPADYKSAALPTELCQLTLFLFNEPGQTPTLGSVQANQPNRGVPGSIPVRTVAGCRLPVLGSRFSVPGSRFSVLRQHWTVRVARRP